MIKVLFVCLGNICRSPMAEAYFRDLVKKEGLEKQIFVDSAGTGNWHVGEGPHHGTEEILRKNQISTDGLIARQIAREDLEEFDYIIAMDSSNINNIKKLSNSFPKEKVHVLLDFVPHRKDKNVPDPYFTGNFVEVYEMVQEGCQQLLNHIKMNDLA